LFGGGQANLYVYVNNDPVNRTDPKGLWGGAIGVSGDIGACFGLCAGSWSGGGGLYLGTEGFGVYGTGQGGVGTGAHAGYGLQGSYFSSLDAFKGTSIGVEGVVGFGAVAGGAIEGNPSGVVASLSAGVGGGLYAGPVVSETLTYGLSWAELAEFWDMITKGSGKPCP
jgi:hypothetical protein